VYQARIGLGQDRLDLRHDHAEAVVLDPAQEIAAAGFGQGVELDLLVAADAGLRVPGRAADPVRLAGPHWVVRVEC
jgi:hypothetical protein